MKPHDPVVFLLHILDACTQIEEYLDAVELDAFYRNKLLQDGLIRQLEIVGEASKKLPEEFRQVNNDIAWKEIAGMRDKLIHGYFGVDLDVVWTTVQQDIPRLKISVRKLLSDDELL